MSLLAGSGDAIGILIGYLLVVVAGGGLAGWVAHRKGRSVIGWVVLGAFFSIWAVVIVALLSSKRPAGEGLTLSLNGQANPSPSSTGDRDVVRELADLREAGVLTEEEFEAKTARLHEPAVNP
jgi:hypothetical protein